MNATPETLSKVIVIASVDGFFVNRTNESYSYHASKAGVLHLDDVDLTNVYRGVGAGFRLVVPGIGTIGFDFGYPLDERSDQDKGWKPHFQVGTTFR